MSAWLSLAGSIRVPRGPEVDAVLDELREIRGEEFAVGVADGGPGVIAVTLRGGSEFTDDGLGELIGMLRALGRHALERAVFSGQYDGEPRELSVAPSGEAIRAAAGRRRAGGLEAPGRVRLRQTIACTPGAVQGDPAGFVILAGTPGSLRRVARSCRETADWEGARLVDRESDVGLGHVEFDTALVWELPGALPDPDPDDPYPCHFAVSEFDAVDGYGGWNVVNVPLELLEAG